MARRVTPVFLFVMLLVCGMRAIAQSRAQADPANDDVVPLHLGQSMVPLYGPWKFQVGDSPIDPANNQPMWAQPEFDDTTWETVDLTPKDTVNPFQGLSGYVPGWGERGHPHRYREHANRDLHRRDLGNPGDGQRGLCDFLWTTRCVGVLGALQDGN